MTTTHKLIRRLNHLCEEWPGVDSASVTADSTTVKAVMKDNQGDRIHALHTELPKAEELAEEFGYELRDAHVTKAIGTSVNAKLKLHFMPDNDEDEDDEDE